MRAVSDLAYDISLPFIGAWLGVKLVEILSPSTSINLETQITLLAASIISTSILSIAFTKDNVRLTIGGFIIPLGVVGPVGAILSPDRFEPEIFALTSVISLSSIFMFQLIKSIYNLYRDALMMQAQLQPLPNIAALGQEHASSPAA